MKTFTSFSPESKVWVYQANREFSVAEIGELNPVLAAFTQRWTAHNHQLKAEYAVEYNRYIILVVDETQAGASGCSIDKSVRLMKEIEQKFSVNLFDRLLFSYKNSNNVINFADMQTFRTEYTTNVINDDTIVFDNNVQTLAALQTEWQIPLKNSWHKQLVA